MDSEGYGIWCIEVWRLSKAFGRVSPVPFLSVESLRRHRRRKYCVEKDFSLGIQVVCRTSLSPTVPSLNLRQAKLPVPRCGITASILHLHCCSNTSHSTTLLQIHK